MFVQKIRDTSRVERNNKISMPQVKCVKDNSQPLLTGDNEIKVRWGSYTDQLFNLNHREIMRSINLCF